MIDDELERERAEIEAEDEALDTLMDEWDHDEDEDGEDGEPEPQPGSPWEPAPWPPAQPAEPRIPQPIRRLLKYAVGVELIHFLSDDR